MAALGNGLPGEDIHVEDSARLDALEDRSRPLGVPVDRGWELGLSVGEIMLLVPQGTAGHPKPAPLPGSLVGHAKNRQCRISLAEIKKNSHRGYGGCF